MAALPQKIGKYHVQDVAGRGNMGTVYLGYDPFADRNVAIKVSSGLEHLDEKACRVAKKLFFNEAHMAGVLEHPNILKILDAGEENGEPYIVMEYVDGGGTLQPYCSPADLLPVPRVAEIIARCARALDYAHCRGVIHRDIKPTNIMRAADGDVKVGDFGIAQRALADTTHVQGILGSPRYMSPEQIKEDSINGQTDLYSLGVVLFELLTGRVPFPAATLGRLIHQVVNEPAPSVLDLRPDLPAGLDAVVRCALAKDRRQRYRSGSEMASDLAAMFAGISDRQDSLDEHHKFVAIRSLGFFNGFSDLEVWETLRAGTWESFEAGQTIVGEGNIDFSFYILVSGEVNVARGGKVITTFGSGDCFGEMGYVSRIQRMATIRAARDVCLLRINEAQMEHASESCQLRFHKKFLRTLISRLGQPEMDEFGAVGVRGQNHPMAPAIGTSRGGPAAAGIAGR